MKNLILALFFITSLAQAEKLPVLPTASMAVSPFRQLIQTAEQSCPSLQCADSAVTLVPLTAAEMQALPADLSADFLQVANGIANSEWPDTILEGPYDAAFKLVVDQVSYVLSQGQTIGYKVNYHDQAWLTTNCSYDPRQPATLSQCTPGKFVEAAFVQLNLSESFRDPAQFVQFVPDQAANE